MPRGRNMSTRTQNRRYRRNDSSSRSRSERRRMSSSRDRGDLEILLLPDQIERLLAQPCARLMADIHDYDDPLWILAYAPEFDDYNEWEVAYYEYRAGHGDAWVIRRAVQWWGYYEDPNPEYTEWFIELHFERRAGVEVKADCRGWV